MSPRAVIYLRVSTEDQAQSGLSLEAQEAACRSFAAERGWAVAAVLTDAGVSGSAPLRKRRALKEAIATLAPGDALLVAKRDRLLRCDDYDRAAILRAIQNRGAALRSTAGEGTESDAPESWLMAWILDGMARFELLKGQSRTRAALAQKRANRQRCGQLPYGLRLAADGRTAEPDPDDVGLVDACLRLRAAGLSLRRIGAELVDLGYRPKGGGSVFRDSTVRRLIQAGRETTSATNDQAEGGGS